MGPQRIASAFVVVLAAPVWVVDNMVKALGNAGVDFDGCNNHQHQHHHQQQQQHRHHCTLCQQVPVRTATKIYSGAIQCTIRPIQWAYKDTLESLRLGRSRPLKPTAQGYGANCDIAADIEQSPWPIGSSPLHNKLQAASSESKQHNTTRSFPLFNHNTLLLLPCCCCCRFRTGT